MFPSRMLPSFATDLASIYMYKLDEGGSIDTEYSSVVLIVFIADFDVLEREVLRHTPSLCGVAVVFRGWFVHTLLL